MKKQLTPLLEDPALSSDVRELLQAGRDSHVTDYDYGAGLRAHLGHIQAGTPMPEWAKGLEGSGGVGSAATTMAGAKLLAWLALPLIGAGVAAAVYFANAEPAAEQAVVAPGSGSLSGAAVAPVSPSTMLPGTTAPTTAVAPTAAEPAHAATLPSAEAEEHSTGTPRTHATSSRSSSAKRGVRLSAESSSAATSQSSLVPGVGSQHAVGDAPTGRNNAARATVSTHAENAQAVATAQAVAPVAPAANEAEPAAEEASAQQPEPAPQVDDSRLEREMGMLSVAQRVLHSDPARALSLARQGEHEFPGSMFTQERQQLELLALVKLGKLDDAKRLARPYLARYPHGPFSERVRRALATGRVDR